MPTPRQGYFEEAHTHSTLPSPEEWGLRQNTDNSLNWGTKHGKERECCLALVRCFTPLASPVYPQWKGKSNRHWHPAIARAAWNKRPQPSLQTFILIFISVTACLEILTSAGRPFFAKMALPNWSFLQKYHFLTKWGENSHALQLWISSVLLLGVFFVYTEQLTQRLVFTLS